MKLRCAACLSLQILSFDYIMTYNTCFVFQTKK